MVQPWAAGDAFNEALTWLVGDTSVDEESPWESADTPIGIPDEPAYSMDWDGPRWVGPIVHSDIVVSGVVDEHDVSATQQITANITCDDWSQLRVWVVMPGGGDWTFSLHMLDPFPFSTPLVVQVGSAAPLPAGMDINGTWKLYVQDMEGDTGHSCGTIDSWSIEYTAISTTHSITPSGFTFTSANLTVDLGSSPIPAEVVGSSAGTYRFMFHDVLSRALLGEFLVKGAAFNSPLGGPGGQCTGTIPISNRQPAELVKAATEMDQAAVYVIYVDADTNVETYLWGGPITSRVWKPGTREVTFSAVEWKSWFYTRMFGPSTTPPFTNRKSTYTAVDQLTIARDLLLEAVLDYGTPQLTVPMVTSTRDRDLTMFGTDFKYIGDLIDSMADRTDGFDWDISIQDSIIDRLPELVGNLYYPEKSGSVNNTFDRTSDGRGTIQTLGDWGESSAARRTRVWATGAGQPPDQPIAMDEDPAMDEDRTLLREVMMSFGSVTRPSTLSEHAQAERAVTGVTIETIDVALKPSAIKPTSFQVGDRAHLRVQDEWLDVDEPSTRIVDRAIVPFSVSDGGERIIVTLDLSDIEPSDPDEGDTV